MKIGLENCPKKKKLAPEQIPIKFYGPSNMVTFYFYFFKGRTLAPKKSRLALKFSLGFLHQYSSIHVLSESKETFVGPGQT